MRKNIPVQQLMPGMKIVALDIGWTKSPKWTSPFVLNSGEDLALLLQHCKVVAIEQASSEAASNTTVTPNATVTTTSTAATVSVNTDQTPVPATETDDQPVNGKKPVHTRVNQEAIIAKKALIQQRAQQAKGPAAAQPLAATADLKAKISKRFVVASFHECLDVLSKNFARVRAGQPLDADSIKATTNKLLIASIAHPNTLTLLSQLEEKDSSLERKSLDVAILSLSFGRLLGLPKAQLHQLGMSALLHDIGMLKIPETLLQQKETLSVSQMISIQKHVHIGCQMLQQTPTLRPLIRTVAYHHERFDGTGYPSGLKGRKIPLEARILAIVTTFEALTRNRHFSNRDTPTQALRKLYSWRDAQLDGKLVERFIRSVGVYPVGTLVELNKQQIGMVVDVHPGARSKPSVHCLYQHTGQPLAKSRTLNLNSDACRQVKITRTVEPEEIQDFSLQQLADELGFSRSNKQAA